ncbi:BON domain-containing protein [Planctomicrobium sp. SH668]|uniref:BON domain-containing protein n=1 Tax=Planctomicrobium sp. SH668 TaxID=3448126 RepID=UPI003F5BBE67
MLLPRKWALSLGLLAAVPSLTVAGPREFPTGSANAAAQMSAPENAQLAQDVATALKQVQLVYKDVEIECMSGVATIKGQIQNASQRAMVTRVVSSVPGVKTVENKLVVMDAVAAPAAQRSAAHDAAMVTNAAMVGKVDSRIQRVNNEVPAPMSNQVVAQNIAESMTSAGLNGYDIEIRYKAGVASLIGAVDSAEQAQRAHRAASSVPGVNQVLNQLTVNGRPVAQQMQGQPGVVPAGYGMPPQGYPQAPQGYGPPPQQGVPPGAFAGMPVQQAQAMMAQQGPGGPMPQYGNIQQTGGHHLYNQPNLPNYAWPTYAAPDNSAAISYPTQYDASAWPYIGPYYPYPQVPADWRKSTLEWKDGSWSLKFDSRTDKWWWFMNPHNWH